MRRFTDYEIAFAYAQALAKESCHDVALRKVKEFGVTGFNVSFASYSDGDYFKAQIVTKPWEART